MAMDQQYTDCVRELEQVKEERDALDLELSQVDTRRSEQRVACMKAERRADALAAHVEYLRNAYRQWNRGEFDDDWFIMFIAKYVCLLPETSLAQRDARMRSEIIVKLLELSVGAQEAETVRAHARNLLNKNRNQPQEATCLTTPN